MIKWNSIKKISIVTLALFLAVVCGHLASKGVMAVKEGKELDERFREYVRYTENVTAGVGGLVKGDSLRVTDLPDTSGEQFSIRKISEGKGGVITYLDVLRDNCRHQIQTLGSVPMSAIPLGARQPILVLATTIGDARSIQRELHLAQTVLVDSDRKFGSGHHISTFPIHIVVDEDLQVLGVLSTELGKEDYVELLTYNFSRL